MMTITSQRLAQRPCCERHRDTAHGGMSTEMQTVTDEATLIRHVQAGDTQAFEQLYRLHVSRVYALCLRMTGNRSEAEDRTQEVFVKAWEKMGAFEGKSAFNTWLHRIAVNLLISAHRKKSTRDQREQAAAESPDAPQGFAPNYTPQRLDLESALARLPEGARQAFVLHTVEGYKHEEIAAITGMAVGTSKAQAHRARKLLREMLA